MRREPFAPAFFLRLAPPWSPIPRPLSPNPPKDSADTPSAEKQAGAHRSLIRVLLGCVLPVGGIFISVAIFSAELQSSSPWAPKNRYVNRQLLVNRWTGPIGKRHCSSSALTNRGLSCTFDTGSLEHHTHCLRRRDQELGIVEE